MANIIIDSDNCTLCEICTTVCTRKLLQMEDDMIKVSPEMCNLCGHCKAVCPENAVTISDLDADEFEPVPSKSHIPEPDPLLAFFRSRRSTRLYKKDPIERDKLVKIIEAGRFAPTGGNRQPLEYAVIETAEILGKVRDTCIEHHAGNADILLATLADKEKQGESLTEIDQAMRQYAESWPFRLELNRQGIDTLFYHAPTLIVVHANSEIAPAPEVDAGLAAMQMALMAESLGLGTCYNGFLIMAAQSSSELKGLMQIPEKNIPAIAFAIGYPDIEYVRLVSRDPARVKWI
jgi:nitroreductase/NAD-dependent dihydropyrimidine dehydrogenase PreA subunit